MGHCLKRQVETFETVDTIYLTDFALVFTQKLRLGYIYFVCVCSESAAFLDDGGGDHAGEDHDEAQEDEDDAEVEGGHHRVRLVRGRPQLRLLQRARAGHALPLRAHQTRAVPVLPARAAAAVLAARVCARPALAADLAEAPLVALLPLRAHRHGALDSGGERHGQAF